MRRRGFVSLFGGAVIGTPLAGTPRVAGAQPSARPRLVGVLSGFSSTEMRRPLSSFRETLAEHGWHEGTNLRIDARTTDGDYKQLIEDTRALIALGVDVIVTTGTPTLTAVRKLTRTVPVVFALVIDPVGQGLIESLARPGGHATGFTNFEFPIGRKWLEMLRELDPRLTRVTVLANPGNPVALPFAKYIEEAGVNVGLGVTIAQVRNAAEIDDAIEAAAHEWQNALVVLPDGLAVVYRDLIITQANRRRLPAIYPFRLFSEHGGLVSYGVDVSDLFRQVALYVDRILKGDQPAVLPVQAPNKLELVVNLKAAKEIGLVIPNSFLARTSDLIE